MNLFFYMFMEEYKRELINLNYIEPTIEALEEYIKNKSRFTINRNEEGKMHSRYLGDIYEPAIIEYYGNHTRCYYLFDGDIKDCEHPFAVFYFRGEIRKVLYYSSERIKNGKPILISYDCSKYNQYNNKRILSEYKDKYIIESNNFREFTLECDEIY